MWWIGAAAVLSACLSAAALIISFNNRVEVPEVVPDELLSQFAELKKAFRALEADSEKMWDQVQSHLGRISRLKKTIPREFLVQAQQSAQAPEVTAPPVQPAPVQVVAPPDDVDTD